MATVILDLTGTLSQLIGDGSWPLSAFNTGKYRFVWTPTAANTDAAWGTDFKCMLASSGIPNGSDTGGLWIVSDALELYSQSALLFSIALTWAAGAPITITIDMSIGSVTVIGATTGNGTYSFTPGTVFTAGTLGVGIYGGGGYNLPPSTISDIDDGNDSTTRSVTGTSAVEISVSSTRQVSRAAAAAMTVAAALVLTPTTVRSVSASSAVDTSLSLSITSGGSRDVSASSSVDTSLQISNTRIRSASGDSTVVASFAISSAAVVRSCSVSSTVAVSLSLSTGAPFGPGVRSSSVDEFGHGSATLNAPGGYLPPGGGGADVDGRVPTPVNTQVAGSAIYYAVGRPQSVASTAITDNKSNSYTHLHEGTYGIGAGATWKNSTGVCIGASGGTNHVVTSQGVVNNEATLGWDEIQNAHFLVSHAHAFASSGSTQQSPAVSLETAGWVYVDWFGDGNTVGAEGFVWTVTAIGEGSQVGDWQVCDARITNHTNGWIQWKRWRKYFSVATSGIRLQLASLNPTQGADWHAAAFQESNIVSRTVATSSTVDTSVNATSAINRTASGSSTVAASVALSKQSNRSTSGSSQVSLSLELIRSASVAASANSLVGISLSINNSTLRSGAGTSTVSISVSISKTIGRDLQTSSTVEAAIQASRTLNRSFSEEDISNLSLAINRAAERNSSPSSLVDLLLSFEVSTTVGASGSSNVSTNLSLLRTVQRNSAGSSSGDISLDINHQDSGSSTRAASGISLVSTLLELSKRSNRGMFTSSTVSISLRFDQQTSRKIVAPSVRTTFYKPAPGLSVRKKR